MKVLFDAEPLLAFAFDEPGADAVEGMLEDVYDGDVDGCVTTVNLAEFRYVAARLRSAERADAHIADLERLGVAEYGIDGVWRRASNVKAEHGLPLGDAYAVAAAEAEDAAGNGVTLVVGADDDYDELEGTEEFGHLIERFREESG
jgi:predicted nucleic acid-binding protein